ncbi:MAG: thiol reductase thioredoxin [Alphaproteobacteria bacterium HGW-Alphaproteobacteria-14]|nr:MAG: thiol reductase thioredoxin [Alphaproteobacteria bacterium HGW-Alphaproteobacteria-14]
MFVRAMSTFLAFLAVAFAAPAIAAPAWQDYTPAAFARAQDAGKTIVVDVHAVWCPTCKAQAPTLDALRQEPRLKDAVFFKVDFDKEKPFLRQHRIPRQSTVLVFRGKQESARSIAESRPKQLREAVMAGI